MPARASFTLCALMPAACSKPLSSASDFATAAASPALCPLIITTSSPMIPLISLAHQDAQPRRRADLIEDGPAPALGVDREPRARRRRQPELARQEPDRVAVLAHDLVER